MAVWGVFCGEERGFSYIKLVLSIFLLVLSIFFPVFKHLFCLKHMVFGRSFGNRKIS